MSELQDRKHGELRAIVSTIAVEVALVVLLKAAHVPSAILNALLFLVPVFAFFGDGIIGPTEHVQISSPQFEHRIQLRYRSESEQLSNLGFTPSFFYGEAVPLFRLLLIYPAILSLTMWLNREVGTIQNRSRILFGFPIFNSSDRTTYAHPNQLGVKFHTVFQDGTILLTKNFSGKTKYGPTVILRRVTNGNIADAWAEHRKQIRLLEGTGKQVDPKTNFETFAKISSAA